MQHAPIGFRSPFMTNITQEIEMDYPEFSVLHGKTLTKVEQIGDDVIRFECEDGKAYQLFHSQDCCESVTIDDISGDLADLVGTPILLAEEATSSDDPPEVVARKEAEKAKDPENYSDWTDSQTWTFYKLRTIKGSVDIRWHGESNGYYSENVDFREVS
jgi:hypothetical protein